MDIHACSAHESISASVCLSFKHDLICCFFVFRVSFDLLLVAPLSSRALSGFALGSAPFKQQASCDL